MPENHNSVAVAFGSTTTGLNKIQAGGAECTPPRPETDGGSALNVEIQPKGRAGGPESTEIRLLKVKVTWRAGLNCGTESFLPMTEFFYRIVCEPVVVYPTY